MHNPNSENEDPLDPSSIERRDFFKRMFILLAGLIALIPSWPFISFLLPVSKQGTGEEFVKVPDFPSIPLQQPTKLTFNYLNKDAFLTQYEYLDIWVVKHSANEATVYSPICTHLGCRYNWEQSQNQFACPCHASVFDPTGKVVAGPAPRPLDTLPYKIEKGDLFVKWIAYKPGISRKIEA